VALCFAAALANRERSFADAARYSSDLIALSTRHNFAHWLALGAIYNGWGHSALGNAAEGISWIEHGIRDLRATGAVTAVPHHLSLKAEALHLRDRTPEALQAIKEAEALAEKFEQGYCLSDLYRLRGEFLAALDGEETHIETSFCAAISTAREQKSVSLKKRAEGTYAEYRRQKASGSGGREFRLPLW
jgi:predicted ATPase